MFQLDDPMLILAGNCYLSIESELTHNYFAYKVTQDKYNKHLWYVRVLAGDNINNPRDWHYVGVIKQFADKGAGFTPDYYLEHTKKSEYAEDNARFVMMRYVVNNLPDKTPGFKYYHHNRCVRCGRRLTTPDTIKAGIGKYCGRLQ